VTATAVTVVIAVKDVDCRVSKRGVRIKNDAEEDPGCFRRLQKIPEDAPEEDPEDSD
jgi:pyrimidine deaminase RibD-like protein